MATLLIDTEGGSTSVRHLAGKGLEIIEAPTFQDVESVFWRLRKGELKPDVVVIDTATTLATTTRQDVVVDPAELSSVSLWDMRGKISPMLKDWGITTDLISRLFRMYRQLPMVTVFVCHQKEREDPMTGEEKLGPDLNNALLQDVVAFSDVVAHLGIVPQDIQLNGGRVVPAGTRRLRLLPDSKHMAKARVPRGVHVPQVLLDPTLRDVLNLNVGRKITVYGAPGVGKTTFACSLEQTTN